MEIRPYYGMAVTSRSVPPGPHWQRHLQAWRACSRADAYRRKIYQTCENCSDFGPIALFRNRRYKGGMPITPIISNCLSYTLNSPHALFERLGREQYRVFHSLDRTDKTDHFYNFCITAHSLRDYFLNELGIHGKKKREPYHVDWNKIPCLAAAGEIANTAKHGGVKENQKTIGIAVARSSVFNIYESSNGESHHEEEVVCDIEITLSDGSQVKTHALMYEIRRYWFNFLASHGIAVGVAPLEGITAQPGW